MEETKNPSALERNPVTYARHKHEVFWQISLPVGIAVVIVLFLAALTLAGTDATVNKGANVALIWLLAPVFVLTLILIIVLFGAIFGVTNLIRIIPNSALQLLNLFIAIRDQVSNINDRLVQPIIKTEIFKASLNGLKRAFRGK